MAKIILNNELVEILSEMKDSVVPTEVTISVTTNLNSVRQWLAQNKDVDEVGKEELSTALFNQTVEDFKNNAMHDMDILKNAEFFCEGKYCTITLTLVSHTTNTQEHQNNQTPPSTSYDEI